jgi:type I restriction enzyme S subunit
MFESRVEHYEFPEGWTTTRLEDACLRMRQGQILPTNEIEETGAYPVFGANGRIGYTDSYFLNEERVLITCRGSTCGVINMAPERSFVTNNAMILFEKDFLNKYYLYFVLQEFSTMGLRTGSGQPQLTQGILNSHKMPVPPLPEQQRIAQVLSTVQQAIEQQERLIRTTSELKQALMQKLFTEGLRGEAQKQTEIGAVPESWEVVQLQSLADVRGGKRLPKGNSLVPEDTGYPYIRVTDFDDNSVTTEDVLFVPVHLQQGIKRYIIHKDDVYISVAGSIGLVGMVPEELDGANLTENANRLVILDQRKVAPRYLMYWLAAEYCQAEIKSQTLKNAQPKLSLGRIKTLSVALPSRKDQDAMVHALDSVRNKIKVTNRKKTVLQNLFRTLLHELMTGKVRVGNLMQ